MSDFLRKMPSYFLKFLGLGCLSVLLAVPALAQEQTPKEKVPPPASPPPPPKRMYKMSVPRPVPREYKEEGEPSLKGQSEMMEHKKVTGEAGGQEIREKPEGGEK